MEPVTGDALGGPLQPRLEAQAQRRDAWGGHGARILPVRWNSRTCPVTPTIPIGTCPLTLSAIAGPVPRCGTWTISGAGASDLNKLAGQVLNCADTRVPVGQLPGLTLA
jgi:hypothetical protein